MHIRVFRRRAPGLVALLLLVGSWTPGFGATDAVTAIRLSGVARDLAGRLLADVDVLVVPDPPGSSAVVRARTDGDGRFVVSGIPPGSYRLAALKDGYLANWSRVHTALRSTVEVVLSPLPRPGEPGAETVMEDRSWVLRVPRRSLLRDVERDALIADASGSSPGGHASLPDNVQAELMHRIAVAGFGSEAGGVPLEGAETRMELASLVGDRTNIRVEGTRESLGSGPDASLDVAGTRQRKGGLAMDLSVDAGSHSSVDVTAFYNHADLAIPTGADVLERNGQRSWGYDATWAMQLDAASRLAVQLDYVDQTIALDLPAASATGTSNRAIGAETAYEVLADESHLIRVGVRAQRVDLALPLVRTGGAGNTYLGVPGAAGWSAALDFEDAWALTGPTTMIYGVGVRQTLDEADSTLVVPRVGASWSGGRVEVRAVVSYHALPAGGSRGFDAENAVPGQVRLDEPVGIEVRVAAPFGNAWTISADHTDLPLQESQLGLRSASVRENFYLTNGNVADRRTTVTLNRPGASGSFSLRLTDGRAEGFVADSLGWATPYQILAERQLRYRSAAAGVTFPRSGTALALEYVQISERPPGSPDAAYLVRDYVDAEFQQDLVRFGSMDARCRLVVSARMGAKSDETDDRKEKALLALQERLSAGVALVF